jgi:hypothetical protein
VQSEARESEKEFRKADVRIMNYEVRRGDKDKVRRKNYEVKLGKNHFFGDAHVQA